ncbi:hypothetical protein ACT4ZU_06605 [Acinetobacter baumannii]|uniref:hypothetical protein n=1 Tax=Acinetobacter baumannii TaxID=470 RepID=UPI0002CDBAE1|nr:hypothetical protein [Acinetobacter baumannii]ENW50468.1 hypothetical protein F917_01904 [Acinetobacter baumannii NIPH 67]MDC4835240.1 hypothetical protein [Acinetobacter baumannii]MDK2184014.1 hypothetical protein [Acinetobacter baumannii]MDK2256824.1 hypothetical protein [Acinetobacter baumannii]MDK2265144.1 hypothetical protein [Acinetobacter baumannii]
MSSNRITANEASSLANSTNQFDKDYILDQIDKSVKSNLKSGYAVVLFNTNSVSNLEMEAAVRQLQEDGYEATASPHTTNTLKLEVRWPV